MSNLIYPTNVHGLSAQVVKTAEFRNVPQEAPNGYITTVCNAANPIWHFHLEYNYLYDSFQSNFNSKPYAPYSDIQYFIGWFMSMRGTFDDFLFTDPTDFSAGGIRGGFWQRSHNYSLYDVVIDSANHAQMVTTAGTSASSGPPAFNHSGSTTTDNTVVWTDKGLYPTGYPD